MAQQWGVAGASAETPSHIVAQQMREVAANQGTVGTSELLVWADMLERNRAKEANTERRAKPESEPK